METYVTCVMTSVTACSWFPTSQRLEIRALVGDPMLIGGPAFICTCCRNSPASVGDLAFIQDLAFIRSFYSLLMCQMTHLKHCCLLVVSSA